MKIIISGEDKALLKQVEDLAKSLGLKITKKKKLEEKKQKKALEALEDLGKIGAY